VLLAVCAIPVCAESHCQVQSAQAKLLAPDGRPGDTFGFSAAASGDTAVVGAFSRYDPNNSGAAYVYRHTAAGWTQEAKLVAPGGDDVPGNWFGYAVAVFGDTAVIGAPALAGNAPRSGAAFVFTRSGAAWTLRAKLAASDGQSSDLFGLAVAVYSDTIAIGAPGEDTLRFNSGAIYVFQSVDGTAWSQAAKLKADESSCDVGDELGVSVALEGATLVAGADQWVAGPPGAGKAYVFERSGAIWAQRAVLAMVGDEGDGLDLSVAVAGDRIVLGTKHRNAYTGAAFVFARDRRGTDSDPTDDTWESQGTLTAEGGIAGDRFGVSVAISGQTILIGSYGQTGFAGAVHVFRFDGTAWAEQAQLTAPDAAPGDEFGAVTVLSGDVAIIGAWRDTDHGPNSGSAYVFRGLGDCNNNGTVDVCDIAGGISQDVAGPGNVGGPDGIPDECEYDCVGQELPKIVLPDGHPDNLFGNAVAMSGDIAVIGACYHNHANNPAESGAAYVLRFDGHAWIEETELLAAEPVESAIFGCDVAVHDDTIVVGARNDLDEYGVRAGAAYVFRHDALTRSWREIQKLTADDGAAGNQFGIRVALSEDTAVISSPSNEDGEDPGAAYVFVRSNGVWVQDARLTAADATPGAMFGLDVAVLGDTIVVGSTRDDAPLQSSGAAYVFRRTDSSWVQQAKLIPGDLQPRGLFGYHIELIGDRALIGAAYALGSDAAYVFRRDDNGTPQYPLDDTWYQEARLSGSDAQDFDRFGHSSAMEGNLAVIGAPGQEGTGVGSAYVFWFDGTTWVEIAKLTAPSAAAGAQVGARMALAEGKTLLGAPGSFSGTPGEVYFFQGISDCNSNGLLDVCEWSDCNQNSILDACDIAAGTSLDYDRDGVPDECEYDCVASESTEVRNPWAQPNDWFGDCVAIDGDTLVVGAPKRTELGAEFTGAAYVFRRVGTGWQWAATLKPNDALAPGSRFGNVVAVCGNTILVRAPFSGDHVYVFVRPEPNGWSGEVTACGRLQVTGPLAFTGSGAIAIAGDTAIVGAVDANAPPVSQSGAAFVYVKPPAGWSGVHEPDAVLWASDRGIDDDFGNRISICGDTVLIGAPLDDHAAGADAGAAYVFERPTGGWAGMITETAKLTASDAGAGDYFGDHLAIAVDGALIGAMYHDDGAGGAYYFARPTGGWTSGHETTRLVPSDPNDRHQFGRGVCIAGDIAACAVPGLSGPFPSRGAVYIFRIGQGEVADVRELARLSGADLEFGTTFAADDSMGLSGDTLAVGARTHAHDPNAPDTVDAGAVYVFHGISDCNANGSLDICDIESGASRDCNSNGVPDDCDIAAGESDCNSNGLLDVCEWSDCNLNGLLDACDIANGTSFDYDRDGVPDECVPPQPCRADCNCDRAVNWRDIDFLIAAMNNNEWYWRQHFLPGVPICPFANNDANDDGVVNWRDIDPFIALMNTTCP